jgi:hypothetical protein
MATRLFYSAIEHIGLSFWLFSNRKEVKEIHETLLSSPDSPNSAMSFWQGITLTIRSSASSSKRLIQLSGLSSPRTLDFQDLKERVDNSQIALVERGLRREFDYFGSDKGSGHQYS